ncbi:glycosyltransferase family 2 protein [Rhizobium sp. C4]|uniref:glycosyltransferase family 2 protein n=1 Tax=Rhizobium sp. C4 TaxID=1349800 RepID=UPI001E2B4F93|nr:glycosyltransferase family A protein [Rhizobium sp. C4]MCD2173835.1 glycosyltransferase family 2 protein [Rhizobium sp. C4]
MNSAPALISMIASTLGRDVEMRLLLDTLSAQDDGNFELIVVDQNPDDRLVPILSEYRGRFPIQHIKSSEKGLDRGRNLGARHATGDWLLFPDDDSWYPADFLKTLRRLIATEPADIYSGRSLNKDGKEIMVSFLGEDAAISRANIWHVLIEWVIVFRAETYRKAGGFDEDLGAGSGTPWNSGEGQDLVLRCLSQGAKGLFRRALYGFHPEEQPNANPEAHIAKMHGYSRGKGFVMRRHGYSFIEFLPELLRPAAGFVVYTLTGKPTLARRSRAILKGRLYGWRNFKPR